MKRALSAFAVSSTLLGAAQVALASPATATGAGDAGTSAAQTGSECVERLPGGKQRPTLQEVMPLRATSGHAVALSVTVEHGKRETVLPGGFRFGLSDEGGRELERNGFFLPDPDGGAGPSLSSEPSGERLKTRVVIPFVVLPATPGRKKLTLPPLPISVGRANGEIVTLCTQPHTLIVEDPIANTPNPDPKPNPAPRREREVWTTAQNAVLVALVALLVGALVAWLFGKWRRRPKPVPAPPPPRPPWEVALEELFDIKNTDLIRKQRFAEYFDRVSDTVRTYLGARFGFDGLECTTRETLGSLRRIQPPIPVLGDIESFLRQADLVKFARLTPSEAECEIALERGEHIVRQTVPQLTPKASLDPALPLGPPPRPPENTTFAPPGGGTS
jgi:hypothetical protein